MNKTFKLTLFSTLALASLGAATTTTITAHAGEKGDNRTSNAAVKFIPSTDPTNPTDPTDPDNPLQPIDPTDPDHPVKPGGDGPLSIDYVSNLDFGVQKISSSDQTYHAKAQYGKKPDGTIKMVPNYAQVTDNRGTLGGWSLSVKQDGDFVTDKNEVLAGAEISIANAAISTNVKDKKASVVNSITLNKSDQIVMAAKTGEGAGTYSYVMGTAGNVAENKDAVTDSDKHKDASGKDKPDDKRFESSDVTLKVPGKSEKLAKAYTATMTWTLSDVPAS